MTSIPTADQAEDAAARALAVLFCRALAEAVHGPGEFPAGAVNAPGFAYIETACRVLLRGPLDETYARVPGGYCMRAPRDPDLYALGRYGARLVEASYTAHDAASALAEVGPLPPLSGIGTREERS